ncbi:MAG: HAMP domain-containing sensor histidine kinase, partial [Actinomycetota bacterium]|nr:HAMP domain-containing sensor histidine kinase [Actinomycetota bacterium]
WHFDRTEGSALVRARPTELAAAIDILLENAFAHTPEGTAVSIEIQTGSGWVHVAIGDAGQGLEPGAERRGESAGGSTGLGLDIARRFAEGAGGELDLGTSELGGAEVVLWLPLVSGGWAPSDGPNGPV